MHLLNDPLATIATGAVALVGLYFVARLIFIAYFKAKRHYQLKLLQTLRGEGD